MNDVDREWLKDMLEYARAAIRVLGTADAEALEMDERAFLAVSHAIQIVGEAASKVSPEGRVAFSSEIPWPKVVGMRHRLVHGYRVRSAELLVKTAREDLPALISVLAGVLEDRNS
jgi:uncharacterized protein with HEPN domain